MKALIWKKTTDADLTLDQEVLVKSYKGTIDLGLNVPFKKATISDIRGRKNKIYTVGECEYFADELTLIVA